MARLAPAPTQAMAQRAAELRAAGRSVIDLSVGEPDQDTPARVVEAGRAALAAGRTRYAPSAGLPELRAAVARAYRRDSGARFEPQQVCVTAGGKQALYLTVQALLGPGDELLVPCPYWPTFPEAARLAGARARPLPLDEERGFRLQARAVRAALGPRTRALVVNSPSNPTGVLVEPEELLAIGRLARRRGLALLYDDTYARLSFDSTIPPLDELRRVLGDGLVVLGTASKTYCMTGWRVGWVLGARRLVEACSSLASHSTQSPATFAQVAAVAALDGPQDGVAGLADEYRRRRDLLWPALTRLPGVSCVRPGGAFYLFPNLRAHLGRRRPDTWALAEALLEEQGVACVPGEGFGCPGYLRFSFARPQAELAEAARRCAAFLAAGA